MAQTIRKSQRGFIVTIELLLIATILVLGLIVGMVSMRDAVLAELGDLSEAIGALNQSYNVLGVNNAANTAATSGSTWQDDYDTAYNAYLATSGPIDYAGFNGDAGYADLDFAAWGTEYAPAAIP